jgi:drug/metabolite transporter superfamily protein YnfA
MLKLLDDPNHDIQEAAYRWIACVGADNPAVFDAVSKALADGRMVQPIAENMHHFGPRGLPVIVKALQKYPDPTAITSILYFEHVDWQPAIGVLTALLEDKDEEVQRSAALALGHIGAQAETAIPALIKLHAAGRTYSAYFGYYALAKMSKKARDAMLADARLPGGDYAGAIETLHAEWPDGETSPIVIDALRHPDAKVRRAAASALWGSGAKAAVPALIKCLSDTDDYVACYAAITLGGIGSAAEQAIPALKAAAQRDPGGPHGDLYFAAYAAIREIEQEMKREHASGEDWRKNRP